MRLDSPTTAYLSLGSNMGDRRENLRGAFRLLDGQEGIALRRTSPIYETEPVGNTDQDWFLNCVAEVGTTLEPIPLLDQLLHIEQTLGRIRTVRNAPRTLDIDILLYGDVVLQSAELALPHPRMLQRRFVLEPLRELAPKLIISGTGKTVEQAYAELRDASQVRLLIKMLCA
jgi:2-amino-4-hydroxy-6-hydroxymethyldihydropteridine diphosphokinase